LPFFFFLRNRNNSPPPIASGIIGDVAGAVCAGVTPGMLTPSFCKAGAIDDIELDRDDNQLVDVAGVADAVGATTVVAGVAGVVAGTIVVDTVEVTACPTVPIAFPLLSTTLP
jgi:hypothetical protein